MGPLRCEFPLPGLSCHRLCCGGRAFLEDVFAARFMIFHDAGYRHSLTYLTSLKSMINGKLGCFPNSVPMVFIVFSRDCC